jgi:hypothetical protein
MTLMASLTLAVGVKFLQMDCILVFVPKFDVKHKFLFCVVKRQNSKWRRLTSADYTNDGSKKHDFYKLSVAFFAFLKNVQRYKSENAFTQLFYQID